MFTNDLKKNIRMFISRFGVVSNDQIYKMFRHHNKEAVAYHLKSLDRDNFVKIDDKGIIHSKTPFVTQDKSLQHRLSQAAWLIAEFGMERIMDYHITTYPTQVLFFTNDYTAYDITFMSELDVDQTAAIAHRMFKQLRPENMKEVDYVNHIAYLANKSLVSKVRAFKTFDYYAIRQPDNTVKMYDMNTGEVFRIYDK